MSFLTRKARPPLPVSPGLSFRIVGWYRGKLHLTFEVKNVSHKPTTCGDFEERKLLSSAVLLRRPLQFQNVNSKLSRVVKIGKFRAAVKRKKLQNRIRTLKQKWRQNLCLFLGEEGPKVEIKNSLIQKS